MPLFKGLKTGGQDINRNRRLVLNGIGAFYVDSDEDDIFRKEKEKTKPRSRTR